jgi:hypothetical protein
VTGSDFIKAQLALTAFRDGSHESINGCLAVAFCIRNRVRAGWQGGDWLKVLAHHSEYAASATPPNPYDLPDPRNYTFGLLLQEVDGIFSGSREDDILTPNSSLMGPIVNFEGQPARPVALYYGRLDDPNIREWFVQNISSNHDSHRQIASVGSLTFFS